MTKFFILVQSEGICRQQNKCGSKFEICLGKGRKHNGKREKFLLPAFSLFYAMFSKASFFRVIESRDCVVNCLGKKC